MFYCADWYKYLDGGGGGGDEASYVYPAFCKTSNF